MVEVLQSLPNDHLLPRLSPESFIHLWRPTPVWMRFVCVARPLFNISKHVLTAVWGYARWEATRTSESYLNFHTIAALISAALIAPGIGATRKRVRNQLPVRLLESVEWPNVSVSIWRN